MSMTSEGPRPRRVMASSELLRTVERLCPGWKVLAGPFNVSLRSVEHKKREEKLAAKMLLEARVKGLECRLVMYSGRAFVMRTAKGYIDAETSSKFMQGQTKGAPLSVWEARKS